jgi:hypothetical protein
VITWNMLIDGAGCKPDAYCDLTFVCKATESFSSACYVLTILHPCMVAQARHIAATKRMKDLPWTALKAHLNKLA